MADDLAFYLRGRPFGGGVNSVVQEYRALVDGFGVGRLVVEERHLDLFRRGYAWSPEALARLSGSPDSVPPGAAVVATTNDSLELVLSLFSDAQRVYYYVQDFEPLFYTPQTTQHEVAAASYARASDAVAVVKTRWLAEMLGQHTFFPVVRIRPSIDRSLYRPLARPAGDRRSLVAMVRPVTARRGSARTVAVLNRLASSTSDVLDLDVFGASDEDLRAAGLRLHPRVRNHGRLTSRHVADLLCQSDLLLDLSDYQAFGRTVAEGMAAGVVPVVTERGAPPEFVRDGVSGFLVDPLDVDAAYDACVGAATLPQGALGHLRLGALDAVAGWSVEATASDWFALMLDA